MWGEVELSDFLYPWPLVCIYRWGRQQKAIYAQPLLDQGPFRQCAAMDIWQKQALSTSPGSPWQFLLSKVIHWLIPIYIFFSWKIDTRYNLNFFFPMKYCSLECFRVLGELWKRCEGPILALNSCFYFLITRPKHINSLSFYFRLEKYFPPQELLFCASFSHP